MATKATIETPGTIKPVRLGDLRVSDRSQRQLREHKVNELLSNWHPECLGVPIVSARDGFFYVVDGQHRLEALKRKTGEGWEDMRFPMRVHEGLNEEQEAAMFDIYNTNLHLSVYDRFAVRVEAGPEMYPIEWDIKKIVEGLGLRIGKPGMASERAVFCVSTLRNIYTRSDPETLQRALYIITAAFGDGSIDAKVVDGVAHVCQRYNGVLDDDTAIEKLSKLRGGARGLLSRAETLHKQMSAPKAHCVAAATVDYLNQGKTGKKLPSWWK